MGQARLCRTVREGKPGRPKILIDWEEFEQLCIFHCTLEEISRWFRCSEDTIERAVKREHGMSFEEYSAEKRSIGKVSLRRRIFQQAMSGDRVLLIWLSKNYLGFQDKIEQQKEIVVRSEVAQPIGLLPENEPTADKINSIAD